MTNTHLSLWINCILSSAKCYLDIADEKDSIIETVTGGNGWPKSRAMKRLHEIAEKVNELAANLTALYPAPIANTARCIQRMTAMDIELSPVILAAITKIDSVDKVNGV